MGQQEFAGLRSRARGTGPRLCSFARGMTTLPPTVPPSLEINAEQIRRDPFEGVPNYWLPGKPNHQPSRPRVSAGPEQGGGWGGVSPAQLEGPCRGRKWWAEIGSAMMTRSRNLEGHRGGRRNH